MGDLSKFFSREECECKCCGLMNIDPELLKVMDDIRTMVGHGLIISSGSRCPTHNESEGGKKNSAHLTGLAVDIKVSGSIQRWELLDAIFTHNMMAERMGLHKVVRVGIAKTFIHIDLDVTKPQNVIWVY